MLTCVCSVVSSCHRVVCGGCAYPRSYAAVFLQARPLMALEGDAIQSCKHGRQQESSTSIKGVNCSYHKSVTESMQTKCSCMQSGSTMELKALIQALRLYALRNVPAK